MPEAIAAATLVLMRDAVAGPPEILMIERGRAMAFAAGALVFPGGRVDPGDRAMAAGAVDPDDAAARIAAIRETIEEVGIAVGLRPVPPAAAVARLRVQLARGAPFADLLAAGGLTIDPAALHKWSRWRPEFELSRIYDTRFYVARAPAGAVALADGGESVRALWTTAAAAIADAAAGEHRIIFPTLRNLERLALAASPEAACAAAAAWPAATITPRIERRGGEDWICIAPDQGYPVTEQRLPDAMRG